MGAASEAAFDAHERMALARLAMEGNNFAEALRMLKPLLQAPDVPDDALALGAATYTQIRLFDRAEKLYQRYLEKHPKAAVERLLLGVVQAHLGKNGEAQQAWEQVLKERPDFFPALLYKGLAFMQTGKIEEAKQALDGVLRTAPGRSPFFAQAKELLQMLDAPRASASVQTPRPQAELPATSNKSLPNAYRNPELASKRN